MVDENAKITVIMLSFNERLHIERAIKSVQQFADRVCVVDSYSTDDTVTRIKALGGEVVQNKWVNYATQFNFGLKHFAPASGWVMRLDSDEYVTDELAQQIKHTLGRQPDDVTGVTRAAARDLQRQMDSLRRVLPHVVTAILACWRGALRESVDG